MKSQIEEILKLKTINRLKFIQRKNSVGDRKESSAEHTWSCLMLADYFIDKINYKLNRQKVYEILAYHDFVEIESGDIPIDSKEYLESKSEKEKLAARRLKEKIPDELYKRFITLFSEYNEQKTIESKFAKAIDALDPIILGLDHKKNWKGFSRNFLVKNKIQKLSEFPAILDCFNEIMDYCESNGYFNQ